MNRQATSKRGVRAGCGGDGSARWIAGSFLRRGSPHGLMDPWHGLMGPCHGLMSPYHGLMGRRLLSCLVTLADCPILSLDKKSWRFPCQCI